MYNTKRVYSYAILYLDEYANAHAQCTFSTVLLYIFILQLLNDIFKLRDRKLFYKLIDQAIRSYTDSRRFFTRKICAYIFVRSQVHRTFVKRVFFLLLRPPAA